MNRRPLVSVRLMVYNNEPYIREAIESVLMQKTNFYVEVVVGDDFSTDNTLKIIRSYQDTNKIHIKILNRPEGGEYWCKRKKKNASVKTNFIDILENCQGKYLALLDGDDYWTDPFKLQKQVDFLSNNKMYSLCCHQTRILKDNLLVDKELSESLLEQSFSFKHLISHYNFIPTASVVFRKPQNLSFPKWYYNIPFGDLGLYKLLSKYGEFYCSKEFMCVYRLNTIGVYSSLNKSQSRKIYLKFLNYIYWALSSEEKMLTREKIFEISLNMAKEKFSRNISVRNLYLKMILIKFQLCRLGVKIRGKSV